MKHHQDTKKFGRTQKKHKAVLCSLAENLIKHGQIRTTEAKAKALQPFVEKLITKAADDSESTKRELESKLSGRTETTNKLINEIGPLFKDRPGGYTRITKLPPRKSDGAYEAIIALVEENEEKKQVSGKQTTT